MFRSGTIGLIKLPDRTFTTIDDADIPLAKGRRWIRNATGHVYTQERTSRTCGPRKTTVVFLHRLIAGTPKGMATDHIDGDPLNNRRANLRIVTNAQNGTHKRKRKPGKSPYKGVHRYYNRWQARIGVGYERIHVGSFATAEEAARAYDEAARRYHGEFAALNFPPSSERDAR